MRIRRITGVVVSISLLFTSQLAGAGVLAKSMGAQRLTSVRVQPVEFTDAFAALDFNVISSLQRYPLVPGSNIQSSIWQVPPVIVGQSGYQYLKGNNGAHSALNIIKPSGIGTIAQMSEALGGGAVVTPESIEHKLGRVFDGLEGSKENIKVFLVQAGQPPIGANLKDLPNILTPHFLSAFNRNGHVRLVRGDGRHGTELTPADSHDVFISLELLGLSINQKRVRPDSVPMSNEAAVEKAQSSTEKNINTNYLKMGVAAGIVAGGVYQFGIENMLGWVAIAGLAMNAVRVIKEIRYVGGILRASFRDSQRPRWAEIGGGIVGKIIPAVVNAGIFVYTFSGISESSFGLKEFIQDPLSVSQAVIQLIPKAVESHPVALASAVVLSLAVETFHGIWVNTWSNFQSKLRRLRSIVYQNAFNFIYGALIGGAFRLISYLALPDISSPWSFEYWGAVGMMMVVGTSFGTLGMSGLNSIYEKGIIPRWGRSSIQQIRDFFMMTIGPFLSTGNILASQILFWSMQSLDLIIYITDRFLKTRPIIYIAYESVADSEDFKKMCLNAPFSVKQAARKIMSKTKGVYERRVRGSRKAG